MKKVRAIYKYQITDAHGHNVIVIEQAGPGTSLTNDIENVVDEIIEKENIDISNYLVVYQDTEGVWDGWDHQRQVFIPLRTYGWKTSVLVYSAGKLRSN